MPDPALSALPRLLATDDAVVAVASGRADVVAVPDAARPLFAAAVHELAGIRPVLVAVPTAAEAERIAGDLVPMLGRDQVELFPAWETLPFERVSPALETMGRRLRVMWRLREGGDAAPAVGVAPVRGSIVDVFPATAEHPVRIDQWGDEVERLSEFAVGDQRSTHDIGHVEVFPCRELLPN